MEKRNFQFFSSDKKHNCYDDYYWFKKKNKGNDKKSKQVILSINKYLTKKVMKNNGVFLS